ncbi:MAG: hypothetical protein VX874_11875 [Pseudomonadota bacterium]|nr:hypothetical protein [Pseudomonadota bacterium]
MLRWIGLMGFVWAVAAGPAHADWVSGKGQGIEGYYATECPLNHHKGTGDPFSVCFSLSCEDGNELVANIYVEKWDALSALDRFEVLMIPEGGRAGQFDMRLRDERVWSAPFEYRHLDWLEDMKRGSTATLSMMLAPDQDDQRFPVTLRGSTKALTYIVEQCGLPDFAGQSVRLRTFDDPEAAVRDEIERDCHRQGGTVTYQAGFRTDRDLNADGRMDVEINYGAAVCDTAPTLYCGSAGCIGALFVTHPDGRKIRVLKTNYYEVAEGEPGAIQISFHGSACGKVGAEACFKHYTVDYFDLMPIDLD